MRVLHVLTGRAEPRLIRGRRVMTAIGKRPRQGSVAVGPLGLEGDEQADPSVHGGLAKAVYAYPAAHHAFWRTVRAQARVDAFDAELPPGLLGENLVVEGMDEADCWLGDRWHLDGGAVLVVTEPRQPCFKFNAAMGFAQAARLMAQSGYCGSYLGVLVPGSVAAGAAIRVEPGAREINLKAMFLDRMRRSPPAPD